MDDRSVLDETLDWFEPGELEICPRCYRRRLLRVREADATVCFGCGCIAWPGGDTSVAAIQGRIGVDTLRFGRLTRSQPGLAEKDARDDRRVLAMLDRRRDAGDRCPCVYRGVPR